MSKLLSSVARNVFRKAVGFRRDERGSITIQMIIYSLLLLFSTGLVLDSGRVFTQHSQLQAFTDQLAISAASELDGQPGAIDRAVKAVFGAQGSLPLLRKAGVEYGEFRAHYIGFYVAMADAGEDFQTDMTKAFPAAAQIAQAVRIGGTGDPVITYAEGANAELADGLALFAVVGSEPAAAESVTFGVLGSVEKLFEEGDGTAFGTPGLLGFGAVAAATLTDQSCSELSTLVFCNPWADQETSPLDTDPTDPSYSIPGRSLMYFAPNYDDPTVRDPALNGDESFVNSFFPWNVDHQLFNITAPLSDAAGVCDANNVPILNGEDYLVARDRCLMARAQQDRVCWSSETPLQIAPAHGPSVSRAVNTIFDIWMEPFEQAIAVNSPVGSTGMNFADFFEPDMIATTVYDTADWWTDPAVAGGGPGSQQDGDPTAEYESLGNADAGDYLASTLPRYGMTRAADVLISGQIDVCHINTYRRVRLQQDGQAVPSELDAADCDVDFVGNYYVGSSLGNNYPDAQFDNYWEDMYRVTTVFTADPATQNSPAGCNTAAEQIIEGFADFCAVASVPNGVDTWYEVYQRERAFAADIETRAEQRSRLFKNDGRWCAGDPDTCGADLVTRYGLSSAADPFFKQFPADYMGATGVASVADLFQPGVERRRMRAAMVNCSATALPGNRNADGSYDVADEDLRVVDLYIPTPAAHYCGLTNETDADGNLLPAEQRVKRCPVDQSEETHLFIELIEDVTPEVTRQYTAHLVR